MAKCQMLCGRCKATATWILLAGGNMLDVIEPGRPGIHKVRAANRTLFACDAHKKQLAGCGELYGGRPQSIAGSF